MTASEALPWICRFAGVAFALRGLEVLLIARRQAWRSLWSDELLADEWRRGLPLPLAFARAIFSIRTLPAIAALQVVCAVILAVGMSGAAAAALFLTHLLIAIRFRGAYNGGSDMMGFVVLSSLLIALVPSDSRAPLWGAVYLGLHGLWSYLKAGLVKVREADWRAGRALPVFLARSIRPGARATASALANNPGLARLGAWLVLSFELSAPLWLVLDRALAPAFALAVLFHLVNAATFGLHHFFWIWLACWPGIAVLAALV